MKIVWFSWKDIAHPQAGGAERVGHELRRRLAADGHDVILLTAAWPGAVAESDCDGYKVVRLGNRWTVYFHAWRYYRKHLAGKTDIAIDEINTVPFFARYYAACQTYLFVHQLCRKVWFYEMMFPLSLLGYLIEPIYLRFLNASKVITVSESSKADLVRFGFASKQISIISEGIGCAPLENIGSVEKFSQPTIVSVGAIRPMKRTHHIAEAYKQALEEIGDLRLIVAGQASGTYGRKVLAMLKEYGADYRGPISEEEKKELLGRSHLYISTAVKEGWGLVVTEAASQGTPALAYDVDGLRDSIRVGETGILVCDGDIRALAEAIVDFFRNGERGMGRRAWEASKMVNFENSYNMFKSVLKI